MTVTIQMRWVSWQKSRKLYQLNKHRVNGTHWENENHSKYEFSIDAIRSHTDNKIPMRRTSVKTILLDDKSTAKRATQHWAGEKEAKVTSGVWMGWTDGSRSDDSRVGAAAVCKLGDELRTSHRYLGTGNVAVFEAKLWAIWPVFGEMIMRSQSLLKH